MDVEKAVDERRKEMISLLSKLIAQDTTNPPGNEYLAAAVVKKFFRKNSIRYRVFEREKGRTNLIGYIGKGKPRLIVACHLDTVPAGKGWKSDPFKAKVKGGRIYGRGAVDNKGPLAGVLVAAAILKKAEKRLKGQIAFACLADEERGSKCGMYHLLNKGRLHGEYALVPDIEHELKKIDVAEKGLLFLKITSFGRQAHGSSPKEGINAIWNMLEFLGLFRHYRMKAKPHALLSPPTINLGVIRGGEAPNIVPGECSVKIDIRYLPSQKAPAIISDIKTMLKKVERKNKTARFRLEVIDDQKPVEADVDNELIRSIKKHVKAVTGSSATIIGLSGTTLVKPLAAKGVRAVGFSPGEGMAHKTNEFISVSELVAFSKILCLVSLDLLG
jgi:acetylornithine deacetylase/succinyl-diaminopimelate desuccinylase family protein